MMSRIVNERGHLIVYEGASLQSLWEGILGILFGVAKQRDGLWMDCGSTLRVFVCAYELRSYGCVYDMIPL